MKTDALARPSAANPFPEIADPGEAGTHVVQFYEDDSFLAKTVADFIAGGLIADQPAILVTTPSHRDAITSELEALGFDVKRMRMAGTVQLLDAQSTLDAFLDEGMPNRAHFHDVIGNALRGSR